MPSSQNDGRPVGPIGGPQEPDLHHENAGPEDDVEEGDVDMYDWDPDEGDPMMTEAWERAMAQYDAELAAAEGSAAENDEDPSQP